MFALAWPPFSVHILNGWPENICYNPTLDMRDTGEIKLIIVNRKNMLQYISHCERHLC